MEAFTRGRSCRPLRLKGLKLKNPKRFYLTILAIIALLAFISSQRSESYGRLSEREIEQIQDHADYLAFTDEVSAKTLCEGHGCRQKYDIYYGRMFLRLGSTTKTEFGDPPLNENSIYNYWRRGDRCIILNYRAVEGHVPFVEYENRLWSWDRIPF